MSESAAPRRPAPPRIGQLLDRDWILALSVAFFVAVLVWFGRSVQDFFSPSASDVFVPAFVGQTFDDASSECDRLRLACSILTRSPSDQYPRDVVMAQQPARGTRVREGRAVSLIVSNGVAIFPMPDLRYESLRNANLILAHSRLRLDRTRKVADDNIPADHVVDQNPSPLESVREGSAVTLTLSKGPPTSVKVPNLVDMDIETARDAAQLANVHLGQVVWTPFGNDGPQRGTVVRQSPGAGQLIDPFAPVSLQVSAGPGVTGYLVRQVHVTAAIPIRDDAVHVRMQVRDQTGTWNVFDGYAQGGAKLDFNVTAVGTAELDTYLNNELLDSTSFGVEPPLPKASSAASPRPASSP